MKLRILHKGLLLIFVPLLLQLVFFAQLYNLVTQMEAVEREEASRVSLLAAGDQLIMEFGTTWTTIVCKMFGSGSYSLDPEAYKARMDKLFARLKPLAKDNPGIMAFADEAERTSRDQYNLYHEMQAAAKTESDNPNLQFVSYARLRPRFLAITARGVALKESVDREISGLRKDWDKNESKRASLRQQILIGVVADFAITILLFAAFLWDITKRLKMLVANALLIPTGTKLVEHVSGTDELAVLDEVLHDAADDLLQAREHRKSIMEMLAHDLRSPLTTAKSTVEILLEPSVSASAEQSRAHLTRVRRSLTQLISFVEDLLTIDRLESGKLELELSLFKIYPLIDECFESLEVKAQRRGIKLVKEGVDFEVIADQARLAQVVMNLLSNALKHSPDGGTIKIVTDSDEDQVQLSVIDQGKGIPKAERERIFQKFVQSKDAKRKEGFGLGLAICTLIIDAHKGTLGVKSEVGKGSEFWFTLPKDDDDV